MTPSVGRVNPSSPRPTLVDIILPCLDEAQALPGVLAAVPRSCRAVVVDNGSTDGSPDIAAALGALVIRERRRGYGAAAHAGLLAATAPLVAFCDADGSLDPADVVQLADIVLDGDAELVLGRRRPTARGSWPLHAQVANRVLAQRIRQVTGLRLHDLGPIRVAAREALLDLGLTDRRSGYPLETVLRAHAAGWRVREVDVAYAPRLGRSKVTGTVRGTAQAVSDMSRLLAEAGR